MAALTLCALALPGCAIRGSLDDVLNSPGARPARVNLPGAPINPRRVYGRARPAVVTVIARYGGGAGGPEDLGTGFAVEDGSTIVTNMHVVSAPLQPQRLSHDVSLQLADGTRMKADVLGADPHADIAVLRAARQVTRTPLSFTRRQVGIGDPVMAIGSPLGQTYTMSLGYVTGVDRRISGLAGFKIYGAVQTDAVITMGNSGGPLLDADGRAIGVTAQMLTVGGGGEGLGFAIPQSLVTRSIGYLEHRRHVPYAYLGAASRPLWRGVGGVAGLPHGPGALIGAVRAGSPAARAGLRGGTGNHVVQGSTLRLGGDVITAIDGHRLAYNEELGTALMNFLPGDTVTITYYRAGVSRRTRLTLTDRPLLWPSTLDQLFG